MRKFRFLAALTAVLLLLTACGKTAPETEPPTEPPTEPSVTEAVTEPVTEPAQVQTLWKERYPWAVMVDNQPQALPQSGLQTAKIIYEFLVEGGLSRLMVVTDQPTGEIGPIRSARPAVFDYVVENRAFYAHVGNSEYVRAADVADAIKDMDQFFHAGRAYYRVDRKVPPHNMYADMERFYEAAEGEGYALTPDEPFGMAVYDKETELPAGENRSAIALSYDGYLHQRYTYDDAKRIWTKTINGDPVLEESTGEPLEIKNLITISLPHWLMSNGVHYKMEDIGAGMATVYTNGQRLEVNWEKAGAESAMVLRHNGKEFPLQPGLTYILLLPEWVDVTEE